MEIAMFGHKYIPSRAGGVEVVVQALSTRMAALGHEVVCYNRAAANVMKEYCGVRLKTVPTLNIKGIAAVTSSFFAAILASFSAADVCHIHAEGPAFMSFLPKLFGKRVIVTIHGLDWQREKWKRGFGAAYIRWGERMAVCFADEIIVLSENMQRYFYTRYGRLTHYIPNGVDRPQNLPPEQIKTQYGLEKDGYILYLGRLVPEKGIHYLIEAFRTVRTDKRLVIAGDSSDTNDYAGQLKASALGDARILFTGFVQGQILEELYSNAYLYVLPSDLEGMPLSLLEAMSCGNCCLISDIPECLEVAKDCAVTFRAGDVPALARCLQELCDDAQQVLRYRNAAREFDSGKEDWDAVTKKTLELYQ